MNVQIVGKINIATYRCVSAEIVTDEVVMTEERIEHIRKRHPNDYERFCTYIPRMIAEPDYIVQANKANTAVILKEIKENGGKIQADSENQNAARPSRLPELGVVVLAHWRYDVAKDAKKQKNSLQGGIKPL